MNTAQYYSYLQTTYANDAFTRGELAGAAYRRQQYINEGFSAGVAGNQGKMNPRRAALITAKGEDTNYGGLT